ncbi:hypothetical protein, partial [Geobacillus sp. B4113_201601]|uniref:hypothetical protein n=1 Tax=Geobacillus sp. B4113_201601 TaxID=1586290 RepID=UPI001F190680
RKPSFLGRVMVTLLYQKRNGFLIFFLRKKGGCPKSERYANTFGTPSLFLGKRRFSRQGRGASSSMFFVQISKPCM